MQFTDQNNGRPASLADWPEGQLTCSLLAKVMVDNMCNAKLCDTREDKNFKGSNASCPSIHFLFYVPKANTNKGKQRPSYQASIDFNNLEPDIRNANSLYRFKTLLKNAAYRGELHR